VLVGAPFVPPGEDTGWVARSVEHALGCGAGVVSLIPVRAGNGETDRLAARGELAPPSLARLEVAFDAALAAAGGRGVVLADMWDAEGLAGCDPLHSSFGDLPKR
jgi:hypothetical protein